MSFVPDAKTLNGILIIFLDHCSLEVTRALAAGGFIQLIWLALLEPKT